MNEAEVQNLLFVEESGSLQDSQARLEELVRQCPSDFKDNLGNPWVLYVSWLLFEGSIEHWKWKSDSEDERNHQRRCFERVLASSLDVEDKESVAGWMLSEMLMEVPEYTPEYIATEEELS